MDIQVSENLYLSPSNFNLNMVILNNWKWAGKKSYWVSVMIRVTKLQGISKHLWEADRDQYSNQNIAGRESVMEKQMERSLNCNYILVNGLLLCIL